MTCEACTTAAERLHHLFRSGCKGCAARAVARGPQFHRCLMAREWDTDYRQLLEAVGVTHDQVLAARKADKAVKGRAPA